MLTAGEVDLTEELAVTPVVLSEWEAGTSRVPARHARKLRWLMAVEERHAALRASDLGECPWVVAWEADDSDRADEEILRRLKQLQAHAENCPTCVARERFITERFGPIPDYPHEGFMRVFAWVAGLPTWARPAVGGAMIVGAMVVARAVFMAPQLFAEPGGLLQLLGIIVAAGVAGACGGAAYSLAFPVLGKLGRTGDYLTGIVCVTAYMLGIGLIAQLVLGETLLGDDVAMVAMAIGTVVFGVGIGHMWFWKHRQELAAEAEPFS